MMRIIFMGSPEFAVPSLELLHSSHHEIVCVVTQPDRPSGRKLMLQPPPVKVAAQKLGLTVIQPETTKTAEFVAEIASMRPDTLVVVAYGEILKRDLLGIPPRGAVNLHASMLPKYRGAAPVPWAILQGESITGATTIQINEVMDGGPIFLQQECAILPTDTAEVLLDRIATMGAPLLKRTLDLLESDSIVPTPQDSTEATFAPRLKKEDGLIDWNKPADWIERQIRAFYHWPGCYSYLQNTRIRFWRASVSAAKAKEPPGTIVSLFKDSFWIACGFESVLEIAELQPENRPRLNASDFKHGYRIQIGSVFSSTRLP